MDTSTGPRTTAVSGSDSLQISQGLNTSVGSDHKLFVGGTVGQKVVGGTVPAQGTKAGLYEFVNGGAQTIVGDPASGGLPLQQMMQWVNYAGGYTFVCQPSSTPFPMGGFAVMSSLPASVHLGVDGTAVPDPTNGGHLVTPTPAPFAVMKFEPFLTMMLQLLTLLDQHVHPTAVGPSGPDPVFTAGISSMLATIRSMRVGVGA